MCLFKCITGLVSENPLAVNVLIKTVMKKKKKKKTSGLIEIFMRESNYRVWITYFMFFM